MPISCHPAIFATISNPVQKFRGDSANWPEFKRKWQERLGLLQASGPVDDKILLAQFLDCMDNVTKRQIEARRAENAHMSYQQIFDEVDLQFSRTVKQTSRAKLQTLTLQWSKGERITMKDFNSFDAEFRILRADCKGMSDDEARNLYQCALPIFLAEAVQKQILRKERRPNAIFHGLSGVTPKQLRDWLDESLGTNFPSVTMENHQMVVHCHDDAQFRTLFTLNGRPLSNGETISISSMDAQLSLEEIRQTCKDVLQPRENVQEMKNVAPSVKRLSSHVAPRPSRVARMEEEGSTADDDDEPSEVAQVAPQGPAKAQSGPPSSSGATAGSSHFKKGNGTDGRRPKKAFGKGSGKSPPQTSSSSSSSSAPQSGSNQNVNAVMPPQNTAHDININIRNDPPPQQTGKGANNSSWTTHNNWQYQQNAWNGKGYNQSYNASHSFGKNGKGKGKGQQNPSNQSGGRGKGGQGYSNDSSGKGGQSQNGGGGGPAPPSSH